MKKLASLFLAARLYILVAPTATFLTGAAMNQAVLVANGGKFPVMVNDRALAQFSHSDRFDPFGIRTPEPPRKDGMMDSIHCRMTDKTKLNWLADYINLKTAILSPGDLLIELGDMLSAYASVIWITLAITDYSNK